MDNDWGEHKLYILKNLDELKDDTKEIKGELSTMKEAFVTFKTKIMTVVTVVSVGIGSAFSIISLLVGMN
jgi:hypothetical protein